MKSSLMTFALKTLSPIEKGGINDGYLAKISTRHLATKQIKTAIVPRIHQGLSFHAKNGFVSMIL